MAEIFEIRVKQLLSSMPMDGVKLLHDGKQVSVGYKYNDKKREMQSGVLVEAFRAFALQPETDALLRKLKKRNLPDPIDNVFTNAVHNVPVDDLPRLAGYLTKSEAWVYDENCGKTRLESNRNGRCVCLLD